MILHLGCNIEAQTTGIFGTLESRLAANYPFPLRLHSSPESKPPAFRCKREWVAHARSALTTSAGVVRNVAFVLFGCQSGLLLLKVAFLLFFSGKFINS